MHAWCESELAGLVEKAMAAVLGRPSFAVLAGSKRAVWVVPERTMRLSSGKAIRPEKVDVTSSL